MPRLSVLGACVFFFTLVFASGTSFAAPPDEVSNLRFELDHATLTWTNEPLAEFYNVYRGYVSDLAEDFYGSNFEGGIKETQYTDPTLPPKGKLFFYLITAANAVAEGSMGDRLAADGSTTERINNFPWAGLAVAGKWEGLRSWPVQAIHTAVMHTGKVLTWGREAGYVYVGNAFRGTEWADSVVAGGGDPGHAGAHYSALEVLLRGSGLRLDLAIVEIHSPKSVPEVDRLLRDFGLKNVFEREKLHFFARLRMAGKSSRRI